MTAGDVLDTALFDASGYREQGLPKNLRERFGVPPFSVLNTREGEWQSRKRAWIGMGIRSELGRDAVAFHFGDDLHDKYDGMLSMGNTSIFDPVLCEVMYRWFTPPGGRILDPFAGGSVRGIVAGLMGYDYTGIELRGEQVDANRHQAADILSAPGDVRWMHGDSRDMAALGVDPGGYDFVFSCPPYGDLEVYSDDPRDLSAMDDSGFNDAYRDIIRGACGRLRDDRFACFVVGDYRDKRGHYRDFVGATVDAFRAAGMHLYNVAILVNPAGSLPVRVSAGFDAGRKIGKCHQDVLVFVKGDWRKAAAAACAADN